MVFVTGFALKVTVLAGRGRGGSDGGIDGGASCVAVGRRGVLSVAALAIAADGRKEAAVAELETPTCYRTQRMSRLTSRERLPYVAAASVDLLN